MSTLVPFIQFVSQPAAAITTALAQALAAADHRPPGEAESTAAAFVMSAGVIGLICVYWACWVHARLDNFRIAVRIEKAEADAAARFADALLNNGIQSILVLRGGESEPRYFGDARALLNACKAGEDGEGLAQAIESLVETGASFALSAATPEMQRLAVRGLPVAGRAVLYFQEEAKKDPNFREILDALPMPIWLRGKGRALTWVNNALLRVLGVERLEQIPADRQEWAMPAAAAPAGGKAAEIRRHAMVAGERRTFSLRNLPLNGAEAGIAFDITSSTRLETRLCREIDAQSDMIQHFSTAIAVFDAKQCLARYNRAYANLWGLSEKWLDASPSQDEIFDRLRDSRKLPEQRNFAEWKQEQSDLFDGLQGPSEKFWHLPGGKSLRVVVQPHLLGGLFVQFEDISETLRLESAVTLLTQVQRAILDTIDDGMAIFGTDGRLVLHNVQFRKLWRLTEEELSQQPHFADVANLCTARIGRDGIWGVVSRGVNSANPESLNEWGKARRADGRLISLALTRLPNGATVVTFTDLTDLERFSEERNNANPIAPSGKGIAAP